LCSTEADTSIDRCRPVLLRPGGQLPGALVAGVWREVESHASSVGERITPRGGKVRTLRDEGTDREGRSAPGA
jgi:hypothetical protein